MILTARKIAFQELRLRFEAAYANGPLSASVRGALDAAVNGFKAHHGPLDTGEALALEAPPPPAQPWSREPRLDLKLLARRVEQTRPLLGRGAILLGMVGSGKTSLLSALEADARRRGRKVFKLHVPGAF